MEVDKGLIIKGLFPSLNPILRAELAENMILKNLARDTEILREGQYIKVVPLVVEGLIKVFTRHEDKELLIYYIKPEETCIMSFAAALSNEPSKVFAQTEENTVALLIPVNKIPGWVRQFPEFNSLFLNQYNVRYADLLETIQHLLFDKLDKRLFDYLLTKSQLTGKNPISVSHRQIANDLGTAREVISRVMKKLEQEGKVRQLTNSVELL